MTSLRQVWVLLVAVSVLTAGLLVPALGTAEGSWSTPVNLSETGSYARNPELAVSGDGRTIATVWRRYDGSNYIVQAKISTDSGTTWTKHNLSAHDLSAPGRFASDPQVGVSADGNTIATVWRQYDDGVVQAKISNDRGNTWTAHNLSAPDLSHPVHDASDPQVAVSSDGRTLATTWSRYNGNNWMVQAKISTDSGSNWTKHNLSAPGQNADSPQVGVSAEGRITAITWRGSDASNFIVKTAISADGGGIWTTHDLSAPGQDANRPQVGVSADGKTIATTWQREHSDYHAQAKISTDSGSTWTKHNLSTSGQDAGGPQVGVSADGTTIATTWTGGDDRKTIVQISTSTDSGKTWTKRNLSAPGRRAESPQVGVSGDGRTITTVWRRWDGNYLIQASTSVDAGSTWTRNDLSAPGRYAIDPHVGVSAYGTTIAALWTRYDGSNRIVQVSFHTSPLAVTYTPLERDRTRVRWAGTTGATGYRVLINGKTKCTRSASKSRCTTEKAYGPRAKVRVIALGADADSPVTKAKYQKSTKTIVFGTAHFRPKSAKLTKKNKTIIRKKTKALARQGFKKTTVFGYTAKECTPKKLSKKRAEAVKKVMRKKLRTMDVSIRIKTIAKGNKNPIGNNNTKKGRAKNRRATINIR